jgi:hypothetical protein
MTLAADAIPVTGHNTMLSGACGVWALPPTKECARRARAVVRDAARGLGLGERLVDDAMKMVSELATNAWRHALGGKDLDTAHAPVAGLSEITIYRRRRGTNSEIVVTVFDPDSRLDTIRRGTNHANLAEIPDLRPTETLPPADLDRLLSQLEERGRGLDVVRELSANRCGFYRTRSRLGQFPVPGKAAWFAIPLPLPPRTATSPAVYPHPSQAANALRVQLEARHLGRIYHNELPDRSVLSLPHPYLTIWCADQSFSWRHNGQIESHPFSDLTEVVERMVQVVEDHAAEKRMPDEPIAGQRLRNHPPLALIRRDVEFGVR